MSVALNRVILYVRDVRRLSDFYREAFGFALVEAIEGEWAVFQADQCQLALHRVGPAYRSVAPAAAGEGNNVKLVFAVREDLDALRAKLVASGVAMGEIKVYPGFTGPICDGRDPEGNVFQIAQASPR
jgi:predicted enzyme related to lactoylglutathione lyase